MRICVDITTSRAYSGKPPVGIVRVEREIASHYYNHGANVIFIFFDQEAACYRRIPRGSAAVILGVAADRGAQDAALADDLSPDQFDELFSASEGESVDLSEGDLVISAGLSWDNGVVGRLYSLKTKRNFKLAQIVYDIVPIKMPEYCVPGMDVRFPQYILDVFWTADIIFCISNNTMNDLIEYARHVGKIAPPIDVIEMGSDLIHSENSSIHSPFIAKLKKDRFVLYVSTIEPRKNHALLFNIWRHLGSKKGFDLLPIVFVGKKGWNTANMVDQIKIYNNNFGDKIRLQHDISDEDLIWLYQNARFTVYPSFYEGWGLPVVEALSLGQVCVASSSSSIPEAAGDAADLIDPLDYAKWLSTISTYMSDDAAVEKRRRLVKDRFRPVRWADAMKRFGEKIDRFQRDGRGAGRESSAA